MAKKKGAQKRKTKSYILIASAFTIGLLVFLFLQNQQPSQTNTFYKTEQTSVTKAVNKNSETTSPTMLPYKEPTKYSSKQAVVENGYAFIPELHIKFKVSNDLSDLTYTFFAFEEPGYQNHEYETSFAYISTQKLSNTSQYCSSDHGAIGSIGRSLENPIGKASGPSQENVKKIGDYYYHFLSPQASCTHPDKDEMALESQQIKALRDAFQTMEVTQ